MILRKKRTFKILWILGISVTIVGFLLSTLTIDHNTDPVDVPVEPNLNLLSQSLLSALKDGRDTRPLQDQLANIPMETLENGLQSDAQKYSFWVNIYNAYIQILLNQNPELYNDKNAFFKADQIPIAGKNISFALIEHGILRKSQWELGGGYIHKWFTNAFERKMRVYEADFRIHFALNCGAIDCPPVAIYEPGRLEEQLNLATKQFLTRSTSLKKEEKIVEVTALFNWFRGDFGGKSGTITILEEYRIIPTNSAESLSYKNYDWTLKLNNFTTL